MGLDLLAPTCAITLGMHFQDYFQFLQAWIIIWYTVSVDTNWYKDRGSHFWLKRNYLTIMSYDCVLLYFWCELPLRNASEGSLIILKMTAVKNCLKTTRIYRIICSIRERRCFSEERSFQICHYVCFLNPIFIFSEMESEAWKLMKFWEQIWMEREWWKLFWLFFGSLKRIGSGKLCFVALSISGVCWWNTE